MKEYGLGINGIVVGVEIDLGWLAQGRDAASGFPEDRWSLVRGGYRPPGAGETLPFEQAAASGRFVEEPTRPELERFFFLDDIDRDLIALRRTTAHQLV